MLPGYLALVVTGENASRMTRLGRVLLAGRELFLLLPKPKRGAPTARITSMPGYGVAFAIASLSCPIRPFLAVAGVALRRGDPVAYLAYALGMGLVVAVLAVAAALASTAVTAGVRRLLPYAGRVGGVLLVLTGLYVGYDGIDELRLFHGDADPADPVVDGAAGVQGVLADWLKVIGLWPLVVALVLLTAASVLFSLLRRGDRAGMGRWGRNR